jgi:hypothetical protein
MGAALNARSGPQRWSETRLGQGVLFLGIVWSVAGAFLVLQNVLLTVFAQAVVLGWLSPEITASRHLQEEAAQRCAEPGAERVDGPAAADEETLRRARYAAFQMGMGFGMAAGAPFSGTVGQLERIALLVQETRDHAMELGVPPPELPEIRHLASALSEFTDDLDADHQCTAARLASRYTPAHGDIYRFGAVIGYAAIFCVNDVCGAHGAQIRRYGQAAGLPELLWLPMAKGSLTGVPGVDARERTFRILTDLDEHIRAGR